MESKLIFIRRTKQEEEIFGGIVYVDVDGKNIGQLSTQDLIYEIAPGKHHIKMYKSHKFDTLIGIAEEDIEKKRLIILRLKKLGKKQVEKVIMLCFCGYL